MTSSGNDFGNPESFISPYSEYGLLRSMDPSRTVWLWARIPPSAPLLDGASDTDRSKEAQQFGAFFDGLASQVSIAGMKYRSLLKSQYRAFHLFTCAFPHVYQTVPSMRGTRLGQWQNSMYHNQHVQQQFAFIGVPLRITSDTTGNGQRKPRFMRRLLTTLDRWDFSMHYGAPSFEEYLPDAKKIERVMLNAGFEPFTQMAIYDPSEFEQCVAKMKSWWSLSTSTALPIIAETDHLHLFPDTVTAATAENLYDQRVPCSEWDIPRQYPATVCFAQSSDFHGNLIQQAGNQWIAKLLEVRSGGGANAVGVSVRGIVEPAKITEAEIRKHDRAITESMRERWKREQESTGDMEDAKENLDWKKDIYRHKDMPPTIIDLSVSVLAAGTAEQAVNSLSVVPDIDFVNLNTGYEQLMGFKSMCPCSPVDYTPYQMHWSSTVISGAGASSFASAGDPSGALLGFTEANRQPVYIGTTTVQDEDHKPFFVIIGDTGTGKSMALVNLFAQWSQIPSRDGKGNTPCILINPKQGNDFEDAIRALGGEVRRMDSDMADGTFDPLNVLDDLEQAKNLASIMLASILRSDDDASFETSIASMLTYGIQHGARCCGIALQLAYEAWERHEPGLPDNVDSVWKDIQIGLDSYRMLRLIIGTRENLEPLRVSQNLTLINAGEQSLVPDDATGETVTGRIQQWVLRMSVLGAGAAVRGRDGMVGLDEAWVAMGKGKGAGNTLEQWARLARSQRFTPVLASQKVQEFIDAGLVGGISRALLLALDNPPEQNGAVSPAKQALRLLQVDDSGGRILWRMTQDPNLNNGDPNYNSLKVIRYPKNHKRFPGKLARGSVGYFIDLHKPAVPVEIVIPPALLKQISTTATDVIARERQKQQQQQSPKEV